MEQEEIEYQIESIHGCLLAHEIALQLVLSRSPSCRTPRSGPRSGSCAASSRSAAEAGFALENGTMVRQGREVAG